MEANSQWQPEIWGGIECTINRLGDQFRDQLHEAGHYARPGDISHIASLGITKLRYPILWEKHQPEEDTEIDWNWAEGQLNELRHLNVDPIVGLVHHGSGPAFTHLLDEEFPLKLACYAEKVATRFPWVNYYTPINEPLTTARFSALYGFWYPHLKDELSFIKALLIQVKGIVLSMQAIRKINPLAKLVQTEDLSKIHSSPITARQAAYENERRWLTNDLLCGKVSRDHYFWKKFIGLGIEEKELEFFVQHSCPPDILGFNYYVTSERFLDEKINNYPARLRGGNGRINYVDTEAVRVNRAEGLPVLLKEAWERYRLPIAITECHLSCSREEQLRWLKETWDHCCKLNQDGMDIHAVTAWALFGAFDWDSLLTHKNNNYEPGAFDLFNNQLRTTALAKLIRGLAYSGNYEHPLLDGKGWWQPQQIREMNNHNTQKTKPLLIIGRNGTLGQAFMRICESRSIPFIALSRQDLDIGNELEIQGMIDQYKPWALINAAGYVKVDEAEANANECFAVNTTGPALLSQYCQQKGIRFMTFSSDLVFDGSKKRPYHEMDGVNPLNVYGSSKAEAEKKITSINDEALIIRTSAFFGPWDRYNFVFHVIESLKEGKVIQVPNDVIVSPTYVPDLAHRSLDLFIDEEQGIWHMTNEGMMSWAEFGQVIAERCGFKKDRIESLSLEALSWKASRPLYSVLQSEKGVKLPTLENALVRYFEHEAKNIVNAGK